MSFTFQIQLNLTKQYDENMKNYQKILFYIILTKFVYII